MPISVTDVRSNNNDQLVYAAKKVGRSRVRQMVFKAICRGKDKTKSITKIVERTGLPRKRVLEEAIKLHNFKILEQVKGGTDPVYQKDSFYCQHTNYILDLANNRKKLKNIPTKTNPKIEKLTIRVSIPNKNVRPKFVTIDDIDSFSKVKHIQSVSSVIPPLYEKQFKNGIKSILGEIGHFQDWGGEINDLYSYVKIKGERLRCAFSFKGKGTTGILIPAKMGKRGDQIQRLFRSPADVYLVQYWGQIDETIIELMEKIATAKSALELRKIYYGVINNNDSARLYLAYKKHFR